MLTMQKARAAYESGRFDRALDLYSTALKQGKLSAAVLFNMGNCYFRNGDLPKAILFYRWASYLDPTDPDIMANLRFALSRAGASEPPRNNILAGLFRRISMLTWIAASAVTFSLGCLFAGTYFLLRRRGKALRYALACFVSIEIVALLGIAAWIPLRLHPEAVILADNTPVLYAPVADSTLHFYLPKGSIVRVLRTENGWARIRFRPGGSGWVLQDHLVMIPLISLPGSVLQMISDQPRPAQTGDPT